MTDNALGIQSTGNSNFFQVQGSLEGLFETAHTLNTPIVLIYVSVYRTYEGG